MIYLWHVHIQQIVYFFLGVLLTIVSFMIVLGETTILFTPDKTDTVIKSFLSRGNGLIWHVCILIPLAYFVSVNIYGLFKL